MAGIYIHIPFCKQACSYCNFHFSTTLNLMDEVVEAVCKELTSRKDFLYGEEVGSVYLGGGTPSLLIASDIDRILNQIANNYSISHEAEITLEANPDDLDRHTLNELAYTAINRLSIGVQSFVQRDLDLMNRAHSAKEAIDVLERVTKMTWKHLTVDLIYGSPGLTDEEWISNLKRVSDFGIPHLSAYQLTVEPRTALHAWIAKNKIPAPDDDRIFRQYHLLTEWADRCGYEHYEVSNLAMPGHRAVHNSNYWHRTPYLGVGPSAHSFDGKVRMWNVAHNPLYVQMMKKGNAVEASETLSTADEYNEMIMTQLRLLEGIPAQLINGLGEPFIKIFETAAAPFLEEGTMVFDDGHYRLTRQGRLFADRIASGCFAENVNQST